MINVRSVLLLSLLVPMGCVKVPGLSKSSSTPSSSSPASPATTAQTSTPSSDPAADEVKSKQLVDCTGVGGFPDNRMPEKFNGHRQLWRDAGERFSDWNVGDPIRNKDTLALYFRGKAELPGVIKPYAPHFCAARRGEHTGSDETDLRVALKWIAHFETKILPQEVQQAPARLDGLLGEIDTLLASYDKASEVSRNGQMMDSADSDIGLKLQAADLQLDIIAAGGPSQAAAATAAQKRVAAARDKVLATRTAIADRNIDGQELPKDEYDGGDKASLKAKYKQEAEKYLKKPVLAVFLVDKDWNRARGQQWVGNKLVSYDQGFLAGDVLVKLDDKTAEVVRFTPRKDWLDGGKIKFDVYVPQPVGKVRIAKLNKRG